MRSIVHFFRAEKFFRGAINIGGDAGGGFLFRPDAKDQPAAIGAALDFDGGFDEALLRPAFGWAVFGAGIESKPGGGVSGLGGG